MRWIRLTPLLATLLVWGGCMISEQTGQIPAELTFHFDTGFNRAMVFGRVAGLAIIVFWLFAKFKRHTAIMVGVPILVFAGWTLERDYPSLAGYRIEVRDDALYLNIPPQNERRIPWEKIQEMELEGVDWATAGRGTMTTVGPDGRRYTSEPAWAKLPEWETMKLITENDSLLVRLDKLSVEQRQTLWRAIAKRAHMVKQ